MQSARLIRRLVHLPKIFGAQTMASLSTPQKPPSDSPMMCHQHQLPHLPVPSLQQTMNKYLAAAEPILTPAALEVTRKEVEEFRKPGGIGERLQKLLEKRAETRTNWLSEWWDSVAYLTYRLPTPIHVSPALVYPPDMSSNFDDRRNWLRFAANYVYRALVDMHRAHSGQFPVDKMGDTPLCMTQYSKLTASTRVPHPEQDKQVFYSTKESTHFIVAYKSQFFVVPCYYPGSEQKHLNPPDLYKQLLAIVSSTTSECPISERVGLLTTEHRDTWAKAWQRLSSDVTNAKSLDLILRSAFICCLDDPHPDIRVPGPERTAFSNREYSLLCGRILHGNGATKNSGNRWFDKTMQVVVGSDGGCGSTLEHSMADGPPAMHLTILALQYCTSPEGLSWRIDDSPLDAGLKPEKMKWNLSSQTKDDILNAAENIDRMVDNVDTHVCRFDAFGKEFAKKHRLSPDGFFQLAIQLAYRRLYDCAIPTYESASTRMYQLGRTETIRSATSQSVAFTKGMDAPGVTVDQKRELLRGAIDAHKRYSKEATMGQAIDRHLLGLALIAKENNIPLPGLFTDPSHGKLFHWRLSTSQVPCPFNVILSFGPVVPDGYGIAYNPRQDAFLFSVTSFRSCDTTEGGQMAGAIERALLDMQQIFVKPSL